MSTKKLPSRITVEGLDRAPHRAFLHITRRRDVSTLVPIINSVTSYNGEGDFGPRPLAAGSGDRRRPAAVRCKSRSGSEFALEEPQRGREGRYAPGARDPGAEA